MQIDITYLYQLFHAYPLLALLVPTGCSLFAVPLLSRVL